MMQKVLPDARRTARLTRVFLVLFGLYALLLNLSLLGLSRYTLGIQERSQLDYLDLVASNFTEPPRPYFDFLEFVWDDDTGELDPAAVEDYRPTLDWQTLESALTAALRGPIHSAALLTSRGETILVAGAEVSSPLNGDTHEAISRALGGERVVAPVGPDEHNRRVYTRVVGTLTTDPVAVLVLEARGIDRDVIRRTRVRILISLAVTTIIVIALWIVTMRLMRRTLEAEREAARADRLRALGTLTAGLSHEIRNPLGIISLQAEELVAIAPDVEPATVREQTQSLAADLRAETRRLRDLLEDFLRFTRAGGDDRQRAPVIVPGEVAGQLVRLWSKGLDGGRRNIVYTDSSEGAGARFPEDRLRQVLLNLLRNADEALGHGIGEIGVNIRREGNLVLIDVRDNGPGIPRDELQRIFDPFHTTRAEGTGLGLPLARSLVESHGGTLTAVSSPRGGAVFTVALPIAQDDDPAS